LDWANLKASGMDLRVCVILASLSSTDLPHPF
jgi:hypothetical protein